MRIGFVILLIFGFIVLGLSWGARTYLSKEVSQNCKSCSLEIKEGHFSIFPFGFVLDGIDFKAGSQQTTEFRAKVRSAIIEFSLESLLKKNLAVKKIKIDSPVMLITEGDERAGSTGGNRHIAFKTGQIEISNGSFTYIRKHSDARQSVINVKNIKAHFEPMGDNSSGEIELKSEAEGRLEQTGEFRLFVDAPLFKKEIRVDVGLEMSDLNLGDLSSFFETESGVQLQGTLLKGTSSVQIRKHILDGWVKAKYQGLKIHLRETKDRGATAAFFSNLVESVTIHSNQMKKENLEDARHAHLAREEDETVIQFILRGMKEAALKVATGAKAKKSDRAPN